MDKEFSLDDLMTGDVAAAVSALNGQASARAFQLLEQHIEQAISTFDESNHRLVERLASMLTQVDCPDGPENRIKLLAKASFYFNRIGRAFDGIPVGVAALRLAEKYQLKNLERFAATALGAAYVDSACFEEACEVYERSLVLARELGEADLECLALVNTGMLLKDMGLYQDAIEVTDKVLSFKLDSPRGRVMSLNNATSGLFSAHRLRDEEAALRYLRIGSEVLDDNPLADVVHRATFEYCRAMYLLAHNDYETAEVLIDAAKRRSGDVRNSRAEIMLDIASALCDWASRDTDRERNARKRLIELYHVTKRNRLHHDDVLRALIEVYKRTLTGETTGLDERDSRHPDDVTSGLTALTRIVTQTAKTGIHYAKELVEYNTGSPGIDPTREASQFAAGVKNAKFYRQMNDRGALPKPGANAGQPVAYDPFVGVRAWLGDGSVPTAIANIGNPGAAGPTPDQPTTIRKHDELTAIHCDMAQLRIESLKAAMRTAAYDVAENWALAAEFFDDQTGEHCFRVGRLAGLLAAELGIDPENCLRIEHAARLHDIGKIAVNELILLKPGPLDSNEIVAMRLHTDVGAQLLEHSDDPTLKMAAAIARYHHAWWNGAGYPNTSGENIPLAARICAYADVYDALTNERPYKRAWPHKLAVEQMLCESGAHFDPRLMQPFLKVLERHIGSNATTPSTRLHLKDMEANGLLTSRRKLMQTVQAG
jgi:HD-GYP domain-containing protein (c-di-GMP phosphodiesterase class II)